MKRSSGLETLASVLCAVLLWNAVARAEDWPRWRGPRGDGTWRAPALPRQWPAEGLKAAWRQPVGGGYAGVAAADDRVFTLDRQVSPQEAERLLCFDAVSGEPLWNYSYAVAYGKLDYGNGPRSTPTVHDGRVYTLVGHVHCLDAATGKRLWSVDFVEDHGAKIPTWGLAASPVVWGDLVIVHPGAQPDGCLVALDRQSGAEVWRASPDPAGYCTPVLVGTGGGQQLVAWTPLHVLGLDPATGRVGWSIPYEVEMGVSIATPVFHQGTLVVTGYWEGTKAIRLGDTPQQAELAWEENRFLRGLMSQPLCRDGYVFCLDKAYGLTCFEIATGKKLWDDAHRMTPDDRNPQANLVWLGETDRAIVLNAEGELILARLTPQGYEEESRTKIIGPTWAHPAFAGRHVYARDDAELVCLPLTDRACSGRSSKLTGDGASEPASNAEKIPGEAKYADE